MVASIHQPSFFPWLGLLDKIAKSDVFVYLDDVHANKASNQYRNTFYCDGKIKYLTLPVDYSSEKRIIDLRFKNNSWKQEHILKLENYYRKAPYFKQIFPQVEKLYENFNSSRPVDFTICSMEFLFDIFNIQVTTFLSSKLKCSSTKGNLVLDICKAINTPVYLSGNGALNYMDNEVIEMFKTSNIQILWHNFSHPVYSQLKEYSFQPGLSTLDILFFEGVEHANKIFWSNLK